MLIFNACQRSILDGLALSNLPTSHMLTFGLVPCYKKLNIKIKIKLRFQILIFTAGNLPSHRGLTLHHLSVFYLFSVSFVPYEAKFISYKDEVHIRIVNVGI